MARIPYELLCGVVLNLIDMSIYSDGITLTPVNNPIVGDPFEIKCNTGVNVINTVAITTPDSTIIGSCNPAIHPFPASCANDASYKATLDEATHTLTVNTTSLPSTVGGVWTCTHNFTTDIYNLTLIGIRGLRSYLSPVLSPQDITSETPVNLSATYECIDTPVHFEWFAVDNSSQMTPLDVTNLVEVNESLCTAYLRFDAYTQTYSSSSVKGLNGRYRIGVEAHYSGEVTALQSIQYFNTYFIFDLTTTTEQQTVTNETTTDEIITDETTTDEIITGETTTDEIITDETTTDEIITDETTTMQTNGNSKDNLLEKILVPAVSGTIVLIIIITIIVFCVMRRKTNHENATNKKHNKTKNRRIKTRNNSGKPEQVPMPNEQHVDYNRRNNSGNPEQVPIQNEQHVDYNRRNNYGNPEQVPMPTEHHVDYNRRNNSGNPEKVPMPSEHHVDYNIRNNSGNPEHAPTPNEPPVDYDRWNDHNSHF